MWVITDTFVWCVQSCTTLFIRHDRFLTVFVAGLLKKVHIGLFCCLILNIWRMWWVRQAIRQPLWCHKGQCRWYLLHTRLLRFLPNILQVQYAAGSNADGACEKRLTAFFFLLFLKYEDGDSWDFFFIFILMINNGTFFEDMNRKHTCILEVWNILWVILTHPSAPPQKVEPGEKRPRGRPRKWVWSNRWQLETRSKCPKPPRCLLQLYSPWRRLGFRGWFIVVLSFSTAPKENGSRSTWRAGEESKTLPCLLASKDAFGCIGVVAFQILSANRSLC